MAEWKPEHGKPAMVMLRGVSDTTAELVRSDDLNLGVSCVPIACLHPLPQPITPEAQAVLDAAVAWRKIWANVAPGGGGDVLVRAVDTYRASIAPPDPVKELREAWEELQQNGAVIAATARLERAIAALEGKSS